MGDPADVAHSPRPLELYGSPISGQRKLCGRTRETEAAVKLDAAKQAILEHLQGLGAPTRVVLIVFNNAAEVVYDGPSGASEAIAKVLALVDASGGTSISAALNLTQSTVTAARDELLFRALVVTDGEDDLPKTSAAAANLAKVGVAIDVALIDPTEKGEAVARAIAQQYGTVSAINSAGQFMRRSEEPRRHRRRSRPPWSLMVERHDQERIQLAREKPAEERLAFTAAYPPSIAPDLWRPLVVYLHLAALQEEVVRSIRDMVDAGLEQLVWDYIRSGAYPVWPYAGAATLETQFNTDGLNVIRDWIARLRSNPELAQADFDRAVCELRPAGRNAPPRRKQQRRRSDTRDPARQSSVVARNPT